MTQKLSTSYLFHTWQCLHGASQAAQWQRTLLPIQEMWARPLGWEDPLEKEMATHSSTLVWEIPWTEEPGRLPSTGSQRVRHNSATKEQQSVYMSTPLSHLPHPLLPLRCPQVHPLHQCLYLCPPDRFISTITQYICIQGSSVQSLSRVQLFETPRTAARQASLSDI